MAKPGRLVVGVSLHRVILACRMVLHIALAAPSPSQRSPRHSIGSNARCDRASHQGPPPRSCHRAARRATESRPRCSRRRAAPLQPHCCQRLTALSHTQQRGCAPRRCNGVANVRLNPPVPTARSCARVMASAACVCRPAHAAHHASGAWRPRGRSLHRLRPRRGAHSNTPRTSHRALPPRRRAVQRL